MKYIAKVDSENYLFSLTQDEVLMLMYGEQRPQYDESKKMEVRQFLENLNYGKVAEVPVSEKFSRIISLYQKAKSFDNWESLSRKMDDVKSLFEPVKEYIEKFKDVTK